MVDSNYKDVNSNTIPDTYVSPSLGIPKVDSYSLGTIMGEDEDRKFALTSILDKERIDVETSLTFSQQANIRTTASQKVLGIESRKPALVEFDVDIDEAYHKLNDGSYTPKFKNFISGVNNEERLARGQSTWEQTLNGVAKNVMKAGLYAIDGTVGTVVGLTSLMQEGRFSAVWNNDFARYLDDLNKQLDFKLPNYYSQEQKNMNFLRSMGTTNFWANDVMGGLAFVGGTAISEGIWAAATGGASLGASAGRIATRLGAKSIARGVAKVGGKNIAKSFLRNTVKLNRAYLRSVKSSKALYAINNARFIWTSAGYESGVEARHSLDESIQNFNNSYQKVLGRKPTQQEYSTFMDDAIKSSNKVFAANVALVGASNIAMFGTYFNVGTGLRKGLSKAFSKGAGHGFRPLADGVIQAIKPTKFKRVIGSTLGVLKRPFTEGVIEEGGQGVITRINQNWLAAKFNPDATKENLNLINATTNAFAEAYGTKEGFKEVGIGMIIGFLGGARARGVSGKVTPFGIGEVKQRIEHNEQIAEANNESVLRLTQSSKETISRFGLMNQQNTFASKAIDKYKEGDFLNSDIAFNASMFSKLLADHSRDNVEESVKDFDRVIDNIPNSTFTEEGMSEDQIAEAKGALIEHYTSKTKDFKRSMSIAKANAPIEQFGSEFTHALAQNIFLGKDRYDSIQEIGETIEEVLGEQGFASAAKLYTSLTDEAQQKVERIAQIDKEIAILDKNYSKVQQDITTTTAQQKGKEVTASEVAKLDKLNEQRDQLVKKRDLIREERDNLQTTIKSKLRGDRYAFGGNLNLFEGIKEEGELVLDDDLVQSVNKLQELDEFREVLAENNPKAAELVETLLGEYVRNVKAFRDFNMAFEMMTDPKFGKKTMKGAAHLFKSYGQDFDESVLKDNKLDITNEELEALIALNKQKGVMSDEEAYTLRVLHRITSASFNYDRAIQRTLGGVEDISDVDYSDFEKNKDVSEEIKTSIVDKLINDETLTNREKQIYSVIRDDILSRVEAKKKSKGDNLTKAVKPKDVVDREKPKTKVEELEQQIEDIKKSRSYLDDLDIAGFNETNVPTQVDYDRFNTLVKSQIEGTITPAKQQELNLLEEKINLWGRLEGTTAKSEISLADLLRDVVILKALDVQENNSLPFLTNLNDLLVDREEKKTKGSRLYGVLQSYDKAIFSINKDGDIVVANISLNELFNILSKDGELIVKLGGKLQKATNNLWTLEKPTPKQKYTAQHIVEGKEINYTFHIGDQGQIRMSKVISTNINKGSKLKIQPSNTLPTNYQPLLIEVKVGDKTNLLPVNSDFSFENGVKMDEQALKGAKVGDRLSLSVSTSSPINKEAISKYKQGDDVAKAEVAKSLEENLVIKVVDSQGRFIAVPKSTENAKVGKNDNSFKILKQLRKVAVTKVLEESFKDNQTIDLGMNVSISQVYTGHPTFKIIKDEQGEYNLEDLEFSSEMINKVQDIGYVLGEKIYLRDKTKEYESYPFLSNILQSDIYQNLKVPVVIFDYYGRKIAYPVSLKSIKEDSSYRLDEIIKSELTTTDKIKELNILIHRAGLDIDKYGFTSLDYTQGHLEEVREQFKATPQYNDVGSWLLKDKSINEILVEQALINIDIVNDPFHSPKIKVDWSTIEGLDVEEAPTIVFKEDMDSASIEEVGKIQKEIC